MKNHYLTQYRIQALERFVKRLNCLISWPCLVAQIKVESEASTESLNFHRSSVNSPLGQVSHMDTNLSLYCKGFQSGAPFEIGEIFNFKNFKVEILVSVENFNLKPLTLSLPMAPSSVSNEPSFDSQSCCIYVFC